MEIEKFYEIISDKSFYDFEKMKYKYKDELMYSRRTLVTSVVS